MAYDKDKDKVLMQKEDLDSEGSGMRVLLCSYDGGQAKIQISRLYKGDWTKPGRLTIDEAKFVHEAVGEYLTFLETIEEKANGRDRETEK